MRRISYSLQEAFDLRPRELITLAGAGGKTSLMFTLANELQALEYKVITTTTTHIYPPSMEESPALIMGEEDALESLDRTLARYGHATLAREKTLSDKLAGVSPATLTRLWFHESVDYLLVEADGSAGRPVKAPNRTEPVVPSETTLFVTVAGLSALGKPLNENFCFRPEIACRLMEMEKNQPMDPDGLARLLVHPQGGLKGWRPGMRTICFLNQADDAPTLESANRLAERMMESGRGRIERVIIGQLKPPGNGNPRPNIWSIRRRVRLL